MMRRRITGLVTAPAVAACLARAGCGSQGALKLEPPNPKLPAMSRAETKSPWNLTDLHQLLRSVDIAVAGAVENVGWGPRVGPDDDSIVLREMHIQVEKVFKGDLSSRNELTVVQEGLRPNGDTYVQSGQTFLMPGQAGYFFLVSEGGLLWLAGANGFYTLDGRAMTAGSPAVFPTGSTSSGAATLVSDAAAKASSEPTTRPGSPEIASTRIVSSMAIPSTDGSLPVQLDEHEVGFCLRVIGAEEYAPVCLSTDLVGALQPGVYPIPGWKAWLAVGDMGQREMKVESAASRASQDVQLVGIPAGPSIGVVWSEETLIGGGYPAQRGLWLEHIPVSRH